MTEHLITIFLVLLCSVCSAILTWFIIEKVIKPYVRKEAETGKQFLSELPRLAFFSGLLEIFLYCGSILICKPEFIVFWIGVKTALRWDRKRKEKNSQVIIQRGTYYIFLLGNALNIMFAYISVCISTGKIITWPK